MNHDVQIFTYMKCLMAALVQKVATHHVPAEMYGRDFKQAAAKEHIKTEQLKLNV